MAMKVIDLFSGCGGMSLGFGNAGFSIVEAYDNWDPAVKCYRANFEHEMIQVDLLEPSRVISHLKDIRPDMIIGGPPCQDFSHAGKRIEGERASLTESYATIVKELRPQWYVMENVDRAYKSDSYKRARAILESADFGITEIVLDASLCGVPQKRKRFFSIGKLGESDGFLLNLLTEMKNDVPLTLRQYFGDRLGVEHYYRHPRNYNRRAIFSIDEPAPTMRGVNRPVPSGYPGHHGDTVPISENIRSLTTKERALIQTFPEDFEWIGTKTHVEQMIGNAVPVKLAEFVARGILKWDLDSQARDKRSKRVMDFVN